MSFLKRDVRHSNCTARNKYHQFQRFHQKKNVIRSFSLNSMKKDEVFILPLRRNTLILAIRKVEKFFSSGLKKDFHMK